MRYFFEMSYDGTHYHGWQRQENAISVQQVVEEALSLIRGEETRIVGSGRTDTGVHCEQQYFHADFESAINEDTIRYKLNGLLPHDISINAIKRVADDAHARFSALFRSYEYRISQHKNPFLKKLTYHYYKPLKIGLMNDASALLLGEHDFEAFSKVKTEVDNFNCYISKARWIEEDDLLIFKITANRFLRGMVRTITGTLLEIGEGNRNIIDLENIIAGKDRKKAGRAVPPGGLFLTAVKYSGEILVS